MAFNLDFKLVQIAATKVASTVEVDGSAVNLSSYLAVGRREVKFILSYLDALSTATTTTNQGLTLKIQQSPDSISSDFVDITGVTTGALTSTDFTTAGIMEVNAHLEYPYVRAVGLGTGTAMLWACTAAAVIEQRQS